MSIQHIVGIYLFLQKTSTYFLKDVMKEVNDYNERIKVRFILRICLLFLLFTSSMLYNTYLISPYSFGVLLVFIAFSIATPFIIKHINSVYMPAKIYLVGAFIAIANIHVIVGNAEGLGIILWYIIVILSASFVLDKNWGFLYTILSLGMIGFLHTAHYNGFELFGFNELKGAQRILMTPFRIGIPMCLLYVIIRDFIETKEEAESITKKLLNHQETLNKQITESERSYRGLIEEAEDLIYELDENGKFTYINPVGLKITGYNKDEILKMFYDFLVLEEDRLAHVRFYRKQIFKQEASSYRRFRIRTKSGEIIWLGQRVKMFFDREGKLINSFCIARNITENIVASSELEKAKNEAVKHSNMKNNFMSAMSHELKTPLNAVIALSHNLLEEKPRPEQKEDLKTLLFSANNLLSLLNDILDFTIIESGKVKIKKQKFALDQLLENTLRITKKQLQNKPINIDLQLDSAIPLQLIGDKDRLLQILDKLLKNAIKFTPKGTIAIATRLKSSTKKTATIQFEIKDTGIGIAPEKLGLIFQTFTQADASLNRTYGGTGLGLTIVQKLLEQLDSTIQVESTVGKGSNFFFTLSFERQATPTIQEKPTLISPKEALIGKQILLVEDNKINQLVAKKFLKKWKTKIDVADNGQIAVDKVKAKDYDIILMDLEMPVMDGFEATKRIRLLPNGKLVPIIAVTASSLVNLQEKLEAYQFTDLVLKPFEPNALYVTMTTHSNNSVNV